MEAPEAADKTSSHRSDVGSALDLVMPVYNEERELPAVLDSLARQVDLAGRPLARGTIRVVAVDNASSDGSREILESWARDHRSPSLVVLDEPQKSHVLARIRGANFVLSETEKGRSPWLVFTDSDSLFPPTFAARILQKLQSGTVDVVSHHGFLPTAFWRKVPRLTERQFKEVGSISFGPQTIADLGLDESQALLTPQLFADFQHLPTHCGLAMTKEIYGLVGGYAREFNQDGSERLGVARNLLFRLDRARARLTYILSPPVAVNPRRRLLESEALWADRSYRGGMSDLRDEIRDEHYALLDRATDHLEFETVRRNCIQRFVVDPCLARPERLLMNRRYFGSALDEFRTRIEELHETRDVVYYNEVRPLSDELVDKHFRTIVANIRRLRGLD